MKTVFSVRRMAFNNESLDCMSACYVNEPSECNMNCGNGGPVLSLMKSDKIEERVLSLSVFASVIKTTPIRC